MKGIVVGVDGSEPSSRAIAWAIDQARLRGDVAVTLVHTYRAVGSRASFPSYRAPYASAGTVTQVAQHQMQWLEEHGDSARRNAEGVIEGALKSSGVSTEGLTINRLVSASEPAKTLVEMSTDADLLVVGSRGRGGFKGLRLGSVSEQCVRHARCSVVVIR